MIDKLIAALIIGGAKCLTGARGQWNGCRPDNRQRIFVANHTSHLDFILLWTALPPDVRAHTRPVAAADYWERGFIRPYLAKHVFHAILVRRDGVCARDEHPTDPMVAALRQGDSLILFPEGTRGDGTALQPFKAGVFHISKETPGVELVPVWMDNPHRVLPKGALLLVPMLCSVKFGAPLELEPDEPKELFLGRLHHSVEELRMP
jgi:1-acyl-sn-glycerol-3-phosphate acyltransferase